MTEHAAQIDPRTFRRTVGHFATGVTVVTIDVNGDVRAMTANSFTSLSLDPPLVLFCVGKTTQMGRAIHDASHFTVSILSESQQRLSTYFAGGWKESEPPPFALESWSGGHRLEGCVAAVGCAVETIYEGGDHWIVVGRVLALHGADQAACAPLLFCRGQYAKLHLATS